MKQNKRGSQNKKNQANLKFDDDLKKIQEFDKKNGTMLIQITPKVNSQPDMDLLGYIKEPIDGSMESIREVYKIYIPANKRRGKRNSKLKFDFGILVQDLIGKGFVDPKRKMSLLGKPPPLPTELRRSSTLQSEVKRTSISTPKINSQITPKNFERKLSNITIQPLKSNYTTTETKNNLQKENLFESFINEETEYDHSSISDIDEIAKRSVQNFQKADLDTLQQGDEFKQFFETAPEQLPEKNSMFEANNDMKQNYKHEFPENNIRKSFNKATTISEKPNTKSFAKKTTFSEPVSDPNKKSPGNFFFDFTGDAKSFLSNVDEDVSADESSIKIKNTDAQDRTPTFDNSRMTQSSPNFSNNIVNKNLGFYQKSKEVNAQMSRISSDSKSSSSNSISKSELLQQNKNDTKKDKGETIKESVFTISQTLNNYGSDIDELIKQAIDIKRNVDNNLQIGVANLDQKSYSNVIDNSKTLPATNNNLEPISNNNGTPEPLSKLDQSFKTSSSNRSSKSQNSNSQS